MFCLLLRLTHQNPGCLEVMLEDKNILKNVSHLLHKKSLVCEGELVQNTLSEQSDHNILGYSSLGLTNVLYCNFFDLCFST